MLLGRIYLTGLEDSIGMIGVSIFIFGFIALIGTVFLIKIGFQNNETRTQLHPAFLMVIQFLGGVAGWIALNSPIYLVLFFIDKICVDKDDIACGMLVLIGLFFAIISINAGAIFAIVLFILRKKWWISAGILFALSIVAMIIGGFFV